MKKRTAFTLIELLVVIAIIGILSGLIVISMNGITNKATIAKSQVFSNSLKNSLMMNLVAEYKLEGSANDSWGGNNGTITGATTVSSSCIYDSCLSLNGSTYIYVPDSSVFDFGSNMTAMIWVKGAPSGSTPAFLGQYDMNLNKRSWMIRTNTNKLEAYLSDSGTIVSGHFKNYYTSKVILDNAWHYVGLTWGSGNLKLYIDGADSAVTKSVDDSITSLYNSDANLTIGAILDNALPVQYFTGLVDDARLYNAAIPTSQIKELYYAGLNNLYASGQITRGEYASRINNLSYEY